jgi:hypothetical protein
MKGTRKNSVALAEELAGKHGKASILLLRLLYWTKRADIVKNGHRWVVKSRQEWLEDTGLTLDQYKYAIKHLVDAGLVETTRGIFRNRMSPFLRLTERVLERMDGADSANQLAGDCSNKLAQNSTHRLVEDSTNPIKKHYRGYTSFDTTETTGVRSHASDGPIRKNLPEVKEDVVPKGGYSVKDVLKLKSEFLKASKPNKVSVLEAVAVADAQRIVNAPPLQPSRPSTDPICLLSWPTHGRVIISSARGQPERPSPTDPSSCNTSLLPFGLGPGTSPNSSACRSPQPTGWPTDVTGGSRPHAPRIFHSQTDRRAIPNTNVLNHPAMNRDRSVMTFAIYVFADPGVPGACKIGKDENWPSRYKQARCHSPRGIDVAAHFAFPTKEAVRAAEGAIKRAFATHRRAGDVDEWFDLPPRDAIGRLQQTGILQSGDTRASPTPLLPASARLYDDWREQNPKYASLLWHLWLFEEQSPDRRLKLSYGALYDTAYHYAFTYNPWPVRLIAGFEHTGGVAADSPANTGPNAEIRRAWEHVQAKLGNPASEQVGWLHPGAAPRRVADHLAAFGIRAFALDRPKPPGARVRDPSVSPAVAIGAVPRQTRVAPSAEVYDLPIEAAPSAAPERSRGLLSRLFG